MVIPQVNAFLFTKDIPALEMMHYELLLQSVYCPFCQESSGGGFR